MIRCNLSVLLAERNLKISDVAKNTGISRTTLTALAYNHSKGIQFDTFDTLCNYLKITPNELFIQEKFNYEFDVINYYSNEKFIDKASLKAMIEFQDKRSESLFEIEIMTDNSNSFQESVDGKDYITNLGIKAIYSDEIKNILKSVPRPFITEMENELMEVVKSYLILHFSFDEELETHFF